MRASPAYASRFVGRADELRALGRELGPGRTVGVVGPGGVGKTRFVTQLLGGRRHRTAYVDAAGARRPDQLVGALVRDTGASGSGPLSGVLQRLDETGVEVLFLDCLEGVGAAASPILGRLVDAGRGVVYTSRVAVDAPGARCVTLAPLLDAEDQLDLFFEAAGPFGVDAASDRVAAARVLRHLDGIPLAIELAAARLSVLSLDELAVQVAEAPARALRDPSRADDRSHTMWRSIAWSVELLPAATRDVFERAGAFAGPFDADAARAVCGEVAPSAVDALVGWHLARRLGDRVALYDSAREFAEDALRTRSDRAEIEARHAEWFVARTEGLVRPTPEHVEAVRSVLPELDRIVDQGLAPHADVDALRRARLALHASYFADRERMPIEALDARLVGLLSGPEEPALLDVAADRLRHVTAGHPAFDGAARRLWHLGRSLGSPRHEIWAGYQLAHRASVVGDEATARAWALPALARAREIGHAVLEAQILLGPLNHAPMLRGDHAEVRERLARAESLLGDDVGGNTRAQILLNVGIFHAQWGEWTTARDRLARAFDAAPAVLGAQNHDLGLWAWAMVELGERGADAVEAVEALEARLSPRFVDPRRAFVALVVGVARRLAGGPPVAVDLPPGDDWDHTLAGHLRAAARALDGVPLDLGAERHTDPAARAVRAAASLVGAVAAGSLGPDEALARAAATGPPSWWLHPVLRVLEVAVRERRERDARWAVDLAEGWVRPPGGEPRSLGSRHRGLLAALLAARRGGAGLDAEALFAAGWPGERVAPATAANRVRVAIAALRRAGLAIGWARGRGWTLDTPVGER